MKLTAIIMMFYVLALSLVPCNDHELAHQSSGHQLAQQDAASEPAHSENHQHSSDTCTPFCTCSCCGIALSVFQLHFIELDKPFEESLLIDQPSQDVQFASLDQEAIWLPPKV